ncbi:LexA/Signal peptidase [Nemania sp. FL0916]|nr:LexA/Signal peptidase [Nemania sp. FL0916]
MPLFTHPLRILFATVQSLCLAHVVWAYGISIDAGWGPSMLPTFLVFNDWFVTDKRFRRGRGVQVGDCVVYSIPVEPPGQEGVKRVLGMPGDYVLLNSPPMSPGRAAYEGIGIGRTAAGTEDMIQVPKGHCYVVGDNLPWSRDSRDFGPIPMALIKGKVVAKGSLDGFNFMNWFTSLPSGLQKAPDAPGPSLPTNSPQQDTEVK